MRDIMKIDRPYGSFFLAQAKQACLVMLTAASVGVGDNEKGTEYTEKLKSWSEKTGLSSGEEMVDIMSLVMGTLEPGQDHGGKSPIEVLKDMYKQSIETGGKDSPNAIKMAACVADAHFEAMDFKESLVW
jgi:hypothetical protein